MCSWAAWADISDLPYELLLSAVIQVQHLKTVVANSKHELTGLNL